VKRSGSGSTGIFGAGGSGDTNYFGVSFDSSDKFSIGGNLTSFLITTQVFRDFSAWMHIVVALDTTQGTASNTLKIYVNGVLVTDYDTDNRASKTSSSVDLGFNRASLQGIGCLINSAGNPATYNNCYLANIHFIDGQALTPSSFTEVSATTGQLIPKAFSGSYGTNGFYLKFDDNSTTAALGTDSSGNGNTWTTNNFSVTTVVRAYSASWTVNWSGYSNTYYGDGWTRGFNANLNDGVFVYDNGESTLSLPPGTKWSSKIRIRLYWYGGIIAVNGTTLTGSFTPAATWYDFTSQLGSSGTLNTIRITSVDSNYMAFCAVELDNVVLYDSAIGPIGTTDSLVDTPTSYGTDDYLGGSVRGNYATLNQLDKAVDVTLSNGNLEISHSGSTNVRAARATIKLTAGKWYCEAVRTTGSDCHSGIITAASSLFQFASTSVFYGEDGKLYVDGSVATNYGITIAIGDVVGIAVDMDAAKIYFYKNGTLINTGGTSFTTTGNDWFFKIGTYFSSSVNTVNFGQRAFAYPVSGYKALVDTNLGTPVVAKPNTVMDVVTYTGSGVIQTISGLQFSSDLLWIKCRSTLNTYHTVADTVRGIGSNGAYYRLFANATDPEYDDGFDVTAITSTGFTLPLGSSSTNSATATYVAWAWDAGTTTASNTAGSITSQVRANVSAGFSVVTYTGTGSNATVGHALGVAAGLVIVKRRDTTANWQVRHTSIAAASSIQLNLTNAAASATTVWNSTAPSSTVFSIGTDATINASAGTYVAYCFASVAGYSNAFSYTGNGLEDGVFVYLGFRPRLIMLKRSDSTSGWTLLDTSRLGYNIDNNPLYANTLAAEAATDLLDITSNGFKLRTTDVSVNASTGTYIGFAWAESPFQYARAR
jgi:hypothetical protein